VFYVAIPSYGICHWSFVDLGSAGIAQRLQLQNEQRQMTNDQWQIMADDK
jgi:hypothetical protein